MAGYSPLALSVTVLGMLPIVVVSTASGRWPASDGVNITLITQELLTASALPLHVVPEAKLYSLVLPVIVGMLTVIIPVGLSWTV